GWCWRAAGSRRRSGQPPPGGSSALVYLERGMGRERRHRGSCLFPVMLVTLQVGILGVVFGHHFVDKPCPFLGVIVVQRQESFEAVVGLRGNQDVGLWGLGVDGDRFGGAQLLPLLFGQFDHDCLLSRIVPAARFSSNAILCIRAFTVLMALLPPVAVLPTCSN